MATILLIKDKDGCWALLNSCRLPSQRPHLPILSHWGIRISKYEFDGGGEWEQRRKKAFQSINELLNWTFMFWPLPVFPNSSLAHSPTKFHWALQSENTILAVSGTYWMLPDCTIFSRYLECSFSLINRSTTLSKKSAFTLLGKVSYLSLMQCLWGLIPCTSEPNYPGSNAKFATTYWLCDLVKDLMGLRFHPMYWPWTLRISFIDASRRPDSWVREKQYIELHVSLCLFPKSTKSHGSHAKGPLWRLQGQWVELQERILEHGRIIPFIISGIKTLLFIQEGILPPISRLRSVNTTPGISPWKEQWGPQALGTPRNFLQECSGSTEGCFSQKAYMCHFTSGFLTFLVSSWENNGTSITGTW